MELGGFEPPTSWVRFRETSALEVVDLQGVIDRPLGEENRWIPVDSGRLPPFEPLVGPEWLKIEGRTIAAFETSRSEDLLGVIADVEQDTVNSACANLLECGEEGESQAPRSHAGSLGLSIGS
jgi:hypothetical protein